MRFQRVPTKPASGFTLIELLVTIALAAILASLAAPSMREFIVRNKMSSVGNEFTSSILRVRNKATSLNTCVTMCLSSTVDEAAPSCIASGKEWQVGWIAFRNPGCNNALTAPAVSEDMIFVRRPSSNDFRLVAADETRPSITFDPRGGLASASNNSFTVQYQGSTTNEVSRKYGYKIFLSLMGRTRTAALDATE